MNRNFRTHPNAPMDLIQEYSSGEDEAAPSVQLNIFDHMMARAKAPKNLMHSNAPKRKAPVICTSQQQGALQLITVTSTHSPIPFWRGG